MASDGTVKVDTDLDDSGIKKGLGKVGGTFKSLGSGALGLAKTGFNVLAGAVAATSAAMGAGAAIGLKYNSQMEQYTAQFETLLGSTAKAQQHIKDLNKFAAETPFELPGIADASTTLLSFGVNSGDVMGILQQLGDVSLGNQDKFNSLALVYGQVQSTGKLMGQDLLQMINAGFNPLQVISEKTGKSMGELKEEMSDGAISAEMVAEAFQWATEEGGMFNGGMEKQSQTIAGLTSTLADNGRALLGSIVEPLSNEVKPLVQEAIGWIDELSSALKENGLQGMIETGGTILADILTGIAQAAPEVINTAVSILESLVQGLTDNSDAILQAGFDIIVALVNGVMTLFPLLGTLAWDIIQKLANSFIQNAPSITEQGKTILSNITEGIKKSFPELLKTASDVIMTMIKGLGDMLPDIVTMGIELLLALVDGIASMLPELIPLALNIILDLVGSLLDNIDKVIDSGIKLLLALQDGILNMVPTLVSKMPEIIGKLVVAIAKNLPKLLSMGIQLLANLTTGMLSYIPQLIAAIPRVISSIFNAFKNTDWGSIGRNIIDGVVSGITNAAGRLGEAARNAAKRAFDAAKDFLGIHSPSRLMRDEIGKNMIAGVTVGIDDETPNLVKNVKANMGDVVEEMKLESGKVSIERTAIADGLIGGNITNATNNNNTTNNYIFNQPVETPDETARAIRKVNTFGLAGA